jgi:hypothetical protein
MIILFENFPYAKKDIESVVPAWMTRVREDPDIVILPYVGYSYSKQAEDIVFFLPKIFVDEKGLAFGEIKPETLIYTVNTADLNNKALSRQLYSLSMWIYESIKIYKDSHKDTEVKLTEVSAAKSLISLKRGSMSHTMMEIYFSFLDFNKEHENVFLRRKYESYKGHKINWHKTVCKVQPVIQDSVPIYFNHRTSQSRINYEEELLILYYSVLEYFRSSYGAPVKASLNYPIIKGIHFSDLLNGKGLRKLRAIKNRYFSDTFVKLWKLLYLFFDFHSEMNISPDYEEVLITDNYPMVFESMIDALIGDKTGKGDIKKYYKDQKDGKRVDHLYRERDLFSDENIFFVGDSKYYSSGCLAKGESVEKQFTYAKNIIQYSTNPYSVHTEQKTRYRDPLTEGYNITPNFFISAVIDEDFDASKDNIMKLDGPVFSCQFKDRLFDRDTLTVHRYSINFLFVLSAYISKDSIMKDSFRRKARTEFRKDIIGYLNERYQLFKVYADDKKSIDEIIDANFRKFCGKTYTLQKDKSFFFFSCDKRYLIENNISDTDGELVKIKNELSSIEGVDRVELFSIPEV